MIWFLSFDRENDEQLEMGEVDDEVKETLKPDPEEEKRNERIREFFKKIAGEDLEVDWMELKEILDYAMKNGRYIRAFSWATFSAQPDDLLCLDSCEYNYTYCITYSAGIASAYHTRLRRPTA